MLRSGKLGILSAALASVCCGMPLLFLALGLGSLGFGAVVGKYHWYFTGAGVSVLMIAWGLFFREKRKLCETGCEPKRQHTTQTILGVVSLIVLFFVGLNVYSSLGRKGIPSQVYPTHAGLSSVVLPVEGMTCLTCEKTVEGALKGLPGVISAQASTKSQNVLVEFEPGKVTFDQMIQSINKTGYKARLP